MKKALKLIGITLFVFLVLGCGAKTPSKYIDRHYPTGLSESEKVAIILHLIRENDRYILSESRHESFYSCLSDSIHKERRKIKIFPFDKTIPIVRLARKTCPDEPENKERYFECLKNNKSIKHLEAQGVRYLIIFDYYKEDSKGYIDSSKEYVLYTHKTWSEFTDLYAEIYDLRNDHLSGEISVSDWGTEGYGFGCCYIVPIPYFWFSNTESKSCEFLGENIEKFISDN